MKGVQIPFRKPIKKEKNVLAAIERFFKAYIKALVLHKNVLYNTEYFDTSSF